MKYQLLACLFCAICVPAKAQLGITASSEHSQATKWQVVPENYIVKRRADFLRFGTSGVVDYTFSFRNNAVRFRPALHLQYVKSVYYPHYFQLGIVGLEGNIEFALWGEVDKNGRDWPFRPFLQLSPGLALVNLRYDRPKDDQNGVFEAFKSHSIAPNFGTNIFLEFKLTELLTVAPTAGMRIFPNLRWKNFTEIVTKGAMTGTYDATNLRQFNIGLRVGLTLR